MNKYKNASNSIANNYYDILANLKQKVNVPSSVFVKFDDDMRCLNELVDRATSKTPKVSLHYNNGVIDNVNADCKICGALVYQTCSLIALKEALSGETNYCSHCEQRLNADIDYSCLPISCMGLNFKIDERIAKQLVYHIINLMQTSELPTNKIFKNGVFNWLKHSHLITKHGLPILSEKEVKE